MSNVFVVDMLRTPLDPVHPGYARKLLSSGKAAVFRRYPFTIILKHAIEQPPVTPLRLKLDPGSKTTGFALVNDATGEVVWGGELTHRGQAIHSIHPLLITATGHGCRQMCLMDEYGFPRTKPKVRRKSYRGYSTGDRVKAIIPKGTYKGTHEGYIAIRFRPSFHLNGFDVHPKYLTRVHRHDGYSYSYTKGVSQSSLSFKG